MSRLPKKQRKRLFNLPLHLRRKQLSAHLSKELKTQYKRRSLPVRKGDEVKIVRGRFKGKIGKIVGVNTKKYRIYVEGCTLKKADGSEAFYPIHPSNAILINLDLSDPRRVKIIERKNVKVE